MKKFILTSLILSFSITIGNVAAQKKPSKDPCENAQSQAEMNECSKKEFDKADAELNRVYKQLASKLAGEQKEKLKIAEMAWLKYRDANCDCETFENHGGSIYPLVYNGCLTTMTMARTKEMKAFLDDIDSH